MTDPVMDFSDGPQASEPRRRGRPRSPQTIERDTRVLTALRDGGPQTKEQLVAKLSIKPQHVYLSLWRLRCENRVTHASTGTERHVWYVVT